MTSSFRYKKYTYLLTLEGSCGLTYRLHFSPDLKCGITLLHLLPLSVDSVLVGKELACPGHLQNYASRRQKQVAQTWASQAHKPWQVVPAQSGVHGEGADESRECRPEPAEPTSVGRQLPQGRSRGSQILCLAKDGDAGPAFLRTTLMSEWKRIFYMHRQ